MFSKILIVDDEVDLPLIMQDFLEDEGGFEVAIAHSGESGLELLTSLEPDVCIVDMRLGKMSGNDFIEAAYEKRPQCKFLIHTGSIDYTMPDALKKIGPSRVSVVFKPVSLVTMKEKIESLLEL